MFFFCCCGGAHLHYNCSWKPGPANFFWIRRKSIWRNHGAIKLLFPVYTLSPSSLHHVWSDRCTPHLCNIPTRFIIQSWQASSINTKKLWPTLFFFCSRFTPRRQPAAWELHFTRNSTTNIAHGENEGTKERNSVSLWAFFFFSFLAAHTPQSVPHAVARQ